MEKGHDSNILKAYTLKLSAHIQGETSKQAITYEFVYQPFYIHYFNAILV